jgi:hypothetical protein
MKNIKKFYFRQQLFIITTVECLIIIKYSLLIYPVTTHNEICIQNSPFAHSQFDSNIRFYIPVSLSELL